jgi:hypothetical protein
MRILLAHQWQCHAFPVSFTVPPIRKGDRQQSLIFAFFVKCVSQNFTFKYGTPRCRVGN